MGWYPARRELTTCVPAAPAGRTSTAARSWPGLARASRAVASHRPGPRSRPPASQRRATPAGPPRRRLRARRPAPPTRCRHPRSGPRAASSRSTWASATTRSTGSWCEEVVASSPALTDRASARSSSTIVPAGGPTTASTMTTLVPAGSAARSLGLQGAHDAHVDAGQDLGRQRARQQRTHRVVAAQGVAAGQDVTRRGAGRAQRRSTSRSRKWVAQLMQGS